MHYFINFCHPKDKKKKERSQSSVSFASSTTKLNEYKGVNGYTLSSSLFCNCIYSGLDHLNVSEQARQEFQLVDLIIHDKYNHETLENDIALMKLDRRVDFSRNILPACLPSFMMENIGTGAMLGLFCFIF